MFVVLEGILYTTGEKEVIVNSTQLQPRGPTTATCLPDTRVQLWHKGYASHQPGVLE